jgi:hypothetical protein
MCQRTISLQIRSPSLCLILDSQFCGSWLELFQSRLIPTSFSSNPRGARTLSTTNINIFFSFGCYVTCDKVFFLFGFCFGYVWGECWDFQQTRPSPSDHQIYAKKGRQVLGLRVVAFISSSILFLFFCFWPRLVNGHEAFVYSLYRNIWLFFLIKCASFHLQHR